MTAVRFPRSWRSRHHDASRRGTIITLAAFILTVLLIIGAMCINLTQLATSKTELRLASDAAAKAGAVILGQTQDVELARAAAREIAASHIVAGRNMAIRDIDVRFGYSEPGNLGDYNFQENVEPLNSVLVNTRLSEDALAGEGTFFMGNVLNPSTFELDYSSTATRVDHDLCLVVDRSGSMAWDMSSDAWKYPEDTSGDDDATTSIIINYFRVPDPANSRWAALRRSTDVFFEHLEDLPVEVRCGLVSYSSNFIFGLYESEASTTHQTLTDDYDELKDKMRQIGENQLIGNTNVASGMQKAVNVLTGNNSRVTAKATMVVLTDGIWNQGTDPIDVASAAAAANITVHTITFSEQADQEKMIAVAGIGGGRHYHAPDEESLRAIFAEIAETLPAVLTN